MYNANMTNKLTINTDGGARGNPGPAGIGFVIKHDQIVVVKTGKYIGETTNNTAEYQAVIEALEWLSANLETVKKNYEIDKESPLQLDFNLDSSLVVNQIKGVFKIKQPHLKKLSQIIYQLLQKINAKASFTHVYREHNGEADAMVNLALDNRSR